MQPSISNDEDIPRGERFQQIRTKPLGFYLGRKKKLSKIKGRGVLAMRYFVCVYKRKQNNATWSLRK